MKYLRVASEDEVIVAFLEAELDNPRHAQRYSQARSDSGHENISAEELLAEGKSLQRKEGFIAARGWPDSMLFEGFPKHPTWSYFELEDNDLEKLVYIDYSYWNELSSNTRSPMVVAKNIKENIIVYGQGNDQFEGIAEAVRAKKHFPPLVLGKISNSKFIIIEGHARATGFALAQKVPRGQQAIITNETIDEWANKRKD